MQYPGADTGIDTLSVIRFILFALVINFTRPNEAKQSTPYRYVSIIQISHHHPKPKQTYPVRINYDSRIWVDLVTHTLFDPGSVARHRSLPPAIEPLEPKSGCQQIDAITRRPLVWLTIRSGWRKSTEVSLSTSKSIDFDRLFPHL